MWSRCGSAGFLVDYETGTRNLNKAFENRRLAMTEDQPGAAAILDPFADVGARIDREHLPEHPLELLAEVVHPVVLATELALDRRPGYPLRPALGDAVEALGEPRIEVQAEGTAGERGNGAFVQRYGVILKAGEIVRGQPHHGRPKDA